MGAASASPQSEAPASSATVPTSCEGGSSQPCLMSPKFVKRLCAGTNPDLALALFSKDTPWTRAYVAVRQADPFNGLGGPSSDQKLLFEEELLVLYERKPDMGGMSVSGVGASYALLRWDGTCATLDAREVTLRRPPKPGHANVPWRRLDDASRNALMADDRVAKIAAERKKECKGATMGDVSAKCEKAEKELNLRVVEAVRNGARVPAPAALP